MPTKNRHTIVMSDAFWVDVLKGAAERGADRGKPMSASEWLRRAALNQMLWDKTK